MQNLRLHFKDVIRPSSRLCKTKTAKIFKTMTVQSNPRPNPLFPLNKTKTTLNKIKTRLRPKSLLRIFKKVLDLKKKSLSKFELLLIVTRKLS